MSLGLGMHSSGALVQVVLDYRAVRQDDLSVNKGEYVHVVAANLTR